MQTEKWLCALDGTDSLQETKESIYKKYIFILFLYYRPQTRAPSALQGRLLHYVEHKIIKNTGKRKSRKSLWKLRIKAVFLPFKNHWLSVKNCYFCFLPFETPSFVVSSVLFAVDLLLYPGNYSANCYDIRWWSIRRTCPSQQSRLSFSRTISFHGLLSSSGSDLNVCYSVFPRNAQYTPLPSVMCRIQSFC